MVDSELRLSRELTDAQSRSILTPFPDFTALQSVPASLGHAAHERLEEILGAPVASDDADPGVSNKELGQKSGFALGDRFGRQKVFTDNLPMINNDIARVAEEQGVSQDEVWDEIQEILVGSGIGQPMHRTLDRPLGGAYGMRSYIEEHADNGITIINRGNIANWQARRQQSTLALLGGLPSSVLDKVHSVVYAGSGRRYSGAELWRPEISSFDIEEVGDKKVSVLSEAGGAEKIYGPQTIALLQKLGLTDTKVLFADAGEGAKGDDVMRAAISQSDEGLRDRLIIEVGNAPAGYVQLAGGLVLAQELGISPDQFITISDGVEIVRRDHFTALGLEGSSKVQNVGTALNSLNGWLQTIAAVNRHLQPETSRAR